jgi:hypothetical protein
MCTSQNFAHPNIRTFKLTKEGGSDKFGQHIIMFEVGTMQEPPHFPYVENRNN